MNTPANETIIIVGGGHAAAQLCASLSQAGLASQTTLICEEPLLPYHRPPLSKAFLKAAEEQPMPHRPADWYEQAGIQVLTGDGVAAIDRTQKHVRLQSGRELPWSRLVLATGTRARTLPELDTTLSNVTSLRHAADAERLRALLADAQRVVILGGGFIGLEIAATAHAQGKQVIVLEAAPRLMGRAASPELSEHVLHSHRNNGLDVRTGLSASGFETQDGKVTALIAGGERLPLDLLVLGIGAVPETTLAEAAGLACKDGVIVDAYMRTSDADILAIGDCTRFDEAHTGRQLRLESVQNANDQAKTACATLTGTPAPHRALPWFWSEQGSMRLQMAGLPPAAGTAGQLIVRRQGAKPESFSLFHYVDDKLVCVESVNAPLDHVTSRKLLELGISPAPEAVADAGVALKSFVPTPAPAPAA